MIIDQIGILPSGFLPKSIGRLIDGWEAKDTSKQINEPYKKGIDNKVKPRILRYEKKMNSTVAWIPTKIDIPTPIFFSLFYWILLQMQIRNQTRQIDQWLKRVVNWNKISKCFSFGFRWVPSIIGEEKKKKKNSEWAWGRSQKTQQSSKATAANEMIQGFWWGVIWKFYGNKCN